MLVHDMCNLSENNDCSGVDVEYYVEYVVQFMCTGGHIWDLLGGYLCLGSRKKLDPLDTYVPTVVLAQLQFQDAGTFSTLKQ
jgi:hypothetical protein